MGAQRWYRRRSCTGDSLAKALMGSTLVLVDEELLKDCFKVPAAEDQNVIEQLPRCQSRAPCTSWLEDSQKEGVRMILTPSEIETSSKLRVNLESRSVARICSAC